MNPPSEYDEQIRITLMLAHTRAKVRRIPNGISKVGYLVNNYTLKELNECCSEMGRRKPGTDKQTLAWWLVVRLHPELLKEIEQCTSVPSVSATSDLECPSPDTPPTSPDH